MLLCKRALVSPIARRCSISSKALLYLTIYSSTSTPGRVKPALVKRFPASRTYTNSDIRGLMPPSRSI
nr:hypothetical protein Iba_chr14aCG26200 [Ipomoea batatas]GMD85632.1 hypothetical protein Iba_chr14aCG26230 [Ipomoea batatas]